MFRFEDGTLDKLKKMIGHNNLQHATIVAKLCVGYSEKIPVEKFAALLHFLEGSRIAYKIVLYGNPANVEGVNEFKNAIRELIQDKPIMMVEDYRETIVDARQEAAKRFETYRNDDDTRKQHVNKLLDEDALSFQRRTQPDAAPEVTKENLETVKQELIDVEAMMPKVITPRTKQDGPPITIRKKMVLFYPGSLLKSIANAIEFAALMGYDNKGFIHFKYKLKECNPELMLMDAVPAPAENYPVKSVPSPKLTLSAPIEIEPKRFSSSDDFDDDDYDAIQAVSKTIYGTKKYSPTMFANIISSVVIGMTESKKLSAK